MDDCVNMSSSSHTHNAEGDKGDTISASGLLDQGLLSCVSCGILSFSCVAVVKPRVRTAKYFMTSDYNLINDQLVGSRTNHLADALRSERTNGGILRKLYILQCIPDILCLANFSFSLIYFCFFIKRVLCAE